MEMAEFEDGAVSIHYDIEGDGYPVLLIAPGGMRSANELWSNMPWNPRARLVERFRLVGMDQRNAGRSTGPISADDGWDTYTRDQLALLDHLGIETCHVVGMCIGGPYIMNLLTAAPERFTAAVLLQPVGISDNTEALYEMFDLWAEALQPAHPDMTADDWGSFRSTMWDGEFVLTATRDQVAACRVPMLVAMGNDLYHPESTSREIAALAPNATFVEDWKQGAALERFDTTVLAFLTAHAPDSA
jgi:pimeloyl-ACP methyl ester carboxylesterase